jgi:hypothetical protein
MRRREIDVEDLARTLTTFQRRVLRELTHERACIIRDERDDWARRDALLLTRDGQRRIDWRCFEKLRACRFVRAHDTDALMYRVTTRGRDALGT